ncbi:MAG: CsgG/HfaB family protein [Proteobacteria bacterium]|nr:CsgG/HfaB family protein [Pseudomonadota bacterium]
MGKDEIFFRKIFILAAVLLPMFITACAEIRLNTLPTPPPTAKLRVFIQPISSLDVQMKTSHPSHQEFVERQFRFMQRFLERRGMYEVVPEEEVKAVLGKHWYSEKDLAARWARRDWQLARQVGKAVHAEYAMIVERFGKERIFYLDMMLINIETGKKFKISVQMPVGDAEKIREIIRVSYRAIFNDAKNDMITTAIRKGRRMAGLPTPKTPAIDITTAPIPSAPQKVRELDLEKELGGETMAEGRTRLAIYDFEAPEPFKTVALILSEALREELFRLGNFTLVNRENIVQVMNEMGLQQSGLVDEKHAVQAGKGMAARQIIMGNFGVLGSTSVLQAKRIDVETQGTLALASLKCQQGKEEEILDRLPELVRKLVEK